MSESSKNAASVVMLLFDDVEVLDFAGPFEVFSVTSEINDYSLYDVMTLSESGDIIRARNGLHVKPDKSIDECTSADILIIPGGFGVRALLNNEKVVSWVSHVAKHCKLVLSVCTGSFLLGKCGLLDNIGSTTHHENLKDLAEVAPATKVNSEKRFVDSGKIITSGGIAAGIDMSLYVVEKSHGKEVAERTANYMEYGPGWFSRG